MFQGRSKDERSEHFATLGNKFPTKTKMTIINTLHLAPLNTDFSYLMISSEIEKEKGFLSVAV